MFQRLHQNSYPGRLVFSLLHRWGGDGVVFQKVVPESPRLDWVVFQKLGWCSKKLSQNPRWGGVPKVGVVFQKVVPESSMGWCSKRWRGVPKKLSQNPHCVYYFFHKQYVVSQLQNRLAETILMRGHSICFN